MFSRWGAFVYRFRRPIALIAIVVALARPPRRRRPRRRLGSGGWLDATLRIGRGRDPARHRIRGRQELGHRALPVGRRPAPTPPPRSSRAPSRRGRPGWPTIRTSTASIGYAETGDRRFISTAGDAAYVVIQLDVTDEESVDGRRRDPRPPSCRRPATRYQLTGYGPITKDSAEQSEKDLQKAETRLAADRRARPHPRLRLDRGGRDAAAGRRAGDPEQPGPDLPRRPAGRDEHLRAQHRDDARARAGDRLLAVHRQPLPRGAAPRAERRRGGRARRWRRPARRSSSAASRSRSGCPACSCSRRRPSARSGSPARSSSSARSCSR